MSNVTVMKRFVKSFLMMRVRRFNLLKKFCNAKILMLWTYGKRWTAKISYHLTHSNHQIFNMIVLNLEQMNLFRDYQTLWRMFASRIFQRFDSRPFKVNRTARLCFSFLPLQEIEKVLQLEEPSKTISRIYQELVN